MPTEEQRRIVARVDLLMSLCDSLEAGLLRSQADSGKLMEEDNRAVGSNSYTVSCI